MPLGFFKNKESINEEASSALEKCFTKFISTIVPGETLKEQVSLFKLDTAKKRLKENLPTFTAKIEEISKTYKISIKLDHTTKPVR